MGAIMHRRVSETTQLSYLSNISDLPLDVPLTRISLMVHGWTCQASQFIPLVTRFSNQGLDAKNGNLYIAVDLPGHGESPKSILPAPEDAGMPDLLKKFYEEILSTISRNTRSELNSKVSLDFYGHSLGCRLAFGLLDFFSETHFDGLSLLPSRLILLDGSYTGGHAVEPLDLVELNAKAGYVKHMAKLGLCKYFGPRTSESFQLKYREYFDTLDFAYVLRIMHWYRSWDMDIPTLMNQCSERNERLVAAGKEPVMIVNIQSQQQGADGREGIKKSDVTAYMQLLRAHVGPWLEEHIVEDASHFPHIDDVEEIAEWIHPTFQTACEQSRL